VIAPLRARRPGAPGPRLDETSGASGCPFCEGSEAETPPETYAVGEPDRSADGPGWDLRIVPNKFPALGGDAGRQEVVIHAPRHLLSLADLAPPELDRIAAAWQARAHAARAEGFPYVQALLNEGREAGASRPHTHSQLVWLPEAPPAVAKERDVAEAGGGCPLCALLAEERSLDLRVVDDEDGVAIVVSYAGRVPYELLIAPLVCQPDAFTSDDLSPALRALAVAIRRLHTVEGRVPLNAWVHTFPGGGGHWHVEVVPRLTLLAGLELGAELYVNPLSPETAAERLRSA
jgi:UDPglucose--hexose-1-phosphate uridylyltransferase